MRLAAVDAPTGPPTRTTAGVSSDAQAARKLRDPSQARQGHAVRAPLFRCQKIRTGLWCTADGGHTDDPALAELHTYLEWQEAADAADSAIGLETGYDMTGMRDLIIRLVPAQESP